MEESYKQQTAALELEITCQQNCIDKYYYIKNELTINEENFYEGKGKGGKRYEHAPKEQYLRKIRSDENRHLRFLQLDDKTQLMICKIDGLRSRNDDHFIGIINY